MASGCRICQQIQVVRVPISRTVTEHRKRISDMITVVCGSKMEEKDRLPQHVCHVCLGQVVRTYSLLLKFRHSLRMFLSNPGSKSRCFLCCTSNNEQKIISIDGLSGRRSITIRRIIEPLIGQQIRNRSAKFVCDGCQTKVDFANELRRKCLESELVWLKKVSYPWEKMDVDSNNPEHLIFDLYAEVIQDNEGKAQCSICLLAVDQEQYGKKCEGCKLMFRKCDTIESKAVSTPVGQGTASKINGSEDEGHSDHDDGDDLNTDSSDIDAHCSLEMEAVKEENSQELHASADVDDDNEHIELDYSKIPKPNSDHIGYMEEPKKVLDYFEEYPDDPFPTVRRNGPCCCKCFKFFATKSDLVEHRTQSHASPTGTGKFSCDVCLTLYTNQQSLDEHRRRLDIFVYDFCRSCQIVFESPLLFRQHELRYHMNSKLIKEAESRFDTQMAVFYGCCVVSCYNRYSSAERLRNHLKVAHGQSEEERMSEHTCQYCKEEFSDKSTLMSHWRTEKERYRCRIDSCGFTRMTKSVMVQHCSQKTHSKTLCETKVLTPDMKYFSVIGQLDCDTDILLRDCILCCRCFLTFGTKEELAAHCELHTVEDDKPFPCKTCGKSYTQMGLSLHNRLQEIPTHFYCRPCKTFLWRKLDYVYHKVANHLYDDDLSDKIQTEEDHSFTCCGCWNTFLTEEELIDHRRENHPPPSKSMNLPKCDYCHRYMNTMEMLDKHITFYESRDLYSCKVFGCAFQTKDMDQMRQHIFHGTHKDLEGAIVGVKSTGPDNYRCCVSGCYFRSIDYDELIKHGQAEHTDRREQLSIYHSGQKFTCPVCCKGFDHQISLYRHKHNKKKVRCRGCQREFQRELYSAHAIQCTERLKCEICGKVVSSKTSLRSHINNVHSAKNQSNSETILKVCNMCGKLVKNINQHMRRHANKRDWKCSTCGARFNDCTLLNVHARSHSDERNFPCRQGCAKRYKHAGDRDRHEKSIHLGVKPFACLLCKESFIRDRDLRLHQRKHTGQKLFPCSECRASFDILREYEEHCATHGT